MRRFALILFLMVYTLSSTGASVNLHFCCGELDSVSLSSQPEDGCDYPKEGISKERCCANKHVELKIKTDQEPAVKWVAAPKAFTIPPIQPNAYEHRLTQLSPVYELPHGPPEHDSSLPIFIKNRVFRI